MLRAPRATNASSLASLMCASGSTIFRNSQWRIQNSALQAPARQLRDSWDAIRLAPTSPSFRTTLQLDNASVYLQNTSFINFRSLFGNVAIPLRFPSTNNNVALALSPLHLAVFSCASNFWDNAPLIKYTNQLLWPTTADSSTANYSLLTMHVDEGSDWCTLPPSSAPTPIPTSTTYSDLVAMAYRSSVATTVVLGASLLSTSSVGASVVPRLQGIVGAFRLAARCQLSTSSSGQSSDEGASSDSSGYVANDISDNPLLLHFIPVAPSLAYAVGALIGNTLLVIAVGVVSRFLGVAKHHAIKTVKGARKYCPSRKRVLGEADDSLSLGAEMFLVASEVLPTVPLPASLMLLCGLLQEPTMMAAVASVAYYERDTASVVMGVAIGLCWIALPCVFLWLLLVTHSRCRRLRLGGCIRSG
ncbi:membrane-associated protein, putative [Bodo saltans]|uniref:Membrane-associated protein, putative n=1 Tax=Bodo saltans TaxID=75058 RepID=A0A0S4J3Z4_BODSA|nr:membrane-associated protein, putative [Bodo saltans]|eukprot:CUG75759.1 membrane-associated protein, putative [Bodo saltans]